jgi:hypothetical protein
MVIDKWLWITVPGWNWTVVGEVDKAVLLNDVNTLRNQFLIAGLALSAVCRTVCGDCSPLADPPPA